MTTDFNLELLLGLIAWLLIMALLYRQARDRRILSVGLALGYLFQQAIAHWLGALIYVLPGQPRLPAELNQLGYGQTLVGVCAFALGVLFIGRRLRANQPSLPAPSLREVSFIPSSLPFPLAIIGIVCYLAVASYGLRLPTITALVQMASNLVIVALVIATWRAYHSGQRARFFAMLLIVITFPFLTITLQGYLGYGFLLAIFLISFVLVLAPPRLSVLLMGLVLLYVSLSVYVTYMRDRDNLRAVIWSGQGIEARLDRLNESLNHFEWFDAGNPMHIFQIDRRLNQNLLIGNAVDYMARQHLDYANGETLLDGILALIPRALWTDKTITVGGFAIASKYTGLEFQGDTSVGLGQFLEFYINFGTPGVILGMFIYGGLIALFDARAAQYLARGNWRRFTLWYLPAFGFFAGSIIEVTANVAAAWLVAVVLVRVLDLVYESHSPARPARAAVLSLAGSPSKPMAQHLVEEATPH